MNPGEIPFAPTRASTVAPEVDALFLFELAVSLFFIVLIFGLVGYFIVRYRRRSEDEIPAQIPTHYALEITWTLIPFALMLVMFFWGGALFVKMKKPIDHAMEIHVIGKQWMWKIEHEHGVREINQLHVPIGQPVKLILASQDVIHDFFIPAFRVKQDVLPGSYVTEWFEATRVGEYHFFCSQYCGTDHARMIGTVVAMEPADFQAWLAGSLPANSPAAAGSKLFTSYGCVACHGQRAPTLAGLFNSRVSLQDGTTVIADENYLRLSITHPTAQIVAGYPPVMPSYANLSEEQIAQLIAYIKSLETVRNISPTTTPAPSLEAPSTRPAPADQPSVVPNFPPAQSPYPIPTPGGTRSN